MSISAGQATDFFWRISDAVRADGGPAELVVQALAAVYLLRILDFDDAEEEAVALFEGREHQALLPTHLKWGHLMALAPDELERTVGNQLIPFLEAPPAQVAERLVDRRALLETFSRVGSARSLEVLFSFVGDTPFETPEDRRRAGETLGELVARWAESAGKAAGGFSTPPAVTALMAAIASPELGERIYDPCFGAGGGLVACVERLRQQARFHTRKDWEKVQSESVFGVELNPGIHLVGAVRLMLAGIHKPGLVVGDALSREVGRGPSEGFDCIVAVPPWGGVRRHSQEPSCFPIESRSYEELFVQHIALSLRPGGRAVVAVPDGILFKAARTQRLRKWLVEEYRVTAVVRLPRQAFRPYTNVSTSLIVFARDQVAEHIRMIDLRDSAGEAYGEVPAMLAADAPASNVVDVPVSTLAARHYEFQAPSVADDLLADSLEELRGVVPSTQLRELVAAKIQTGVDYRRDETVDKPGPDDDVLPLVRVADVGERVVRAPDLWIRREAIRGNWQARVLRGGDVVVTSSGTIGRVGLVTNGSIGAVASKSVLVLRPADAVLPEYLAALLRSPTYQDVFQSRSRGATIPHLTAKVLREIEVPLPPLLAQERVSATVRDHGGDALAVLRAVLADEGRPLAAFIDTSAAVDELLELGLTRPGPVRAALSSCLAELRRTLERQAEASEDGELSRWADRLKAWAERVTRLALAEPIAPAASAQFAQLVAIDAPLAASLRAIPTDGSANARRARAWLEKCRKAFSWLASQLAADAELIWKGQLEPESLNSNGRFKCRVTLVASGKAPLTGVEVQIELGESREALSVPYVEGGSEVPIVLEASPDLLTDFDREYASVPFRVTWSCSRLDGAPQSGSHRGVVPVHLPSLGSQTEELEPLGSSPYIVGNPVDRPEMFFGRREVLDRIKVQLAREGVANVVLLEGNRRTGKTSILRRLQGPGELDGWIPVYCSFQKAAGDAKKLGVPTDQLFRTIGFEVVKACFEHGYILPLEEMPDQPTKLFKLQLPKVVNSYFREMEDSLLGLNALVESAIDLVKPKRLLLMLDEFDKLQEGIESGVTSPQAPENIRNLYQSHTSMAGILTGSRRIKRLREEYWSALFGFAIRIGLDPLSPEDARSLVTSPVKGRLRFRPGAVDATTEACARQPYLVQSVCAKIFERAAATGSQDVVFADAEAAMQELVADSEHFKTLWEYVATDRRRYVLWLVHELHDGPDPVDVDLLALRLEEAHIPQPKNDGVEDDLEFLRELELVDQDPEGWKKVYRLTIPLMGRWMKKHVDPDVVRRRAVEQGEEAYQ